MGKSPTKEWEEMHYIPMIAVAGIVWTEFNHRKRRRFVQNNFFFARMRILSRTFFVYFKLLYCTTFIAVQTCLRNEATRADR